MPRGYLWCEASPGSALIRHYYETDGRLLRWKRHTEDPVIAGFFDLGHYCEDEDPVRIGDEATRREDRDVFCFEIAGHGKTHQLFADSSEDRVTWVSGLRHTFLAVQLQNPAESADAMLSNVREACASKGTASTSSNASASGSRTSVGLVLDGVNISTVVKGSPAASDFGGSRIEPNDVLVSVDGKEVDKDSVLDLLRGTDEPGSQVRLKVRKSGTLKTTFEANLRRIDASRIREVATLYQLSDDVAKNPNKALAQKLAERLAAVERLDYTLLAAALEHVSALETLVRDAAQTYADNGNKAGATIFRLQELVDEMIAKGQYSTPHSKGASPHAAVSPLGVSGFVKDKLSALYTSSRTATDDSELQELRHEAERYEAQAIEADKANKMLKRTIEDLDNKLEQAESKVAQLTKLQGQGNNWLAKHEVELVDDLRKRNSALEQELKVTKQKLEELDKMGERLLAQKSSEKDQSSAKAIEEMSKKLVGLERELTQTRQTLREAQEREENLQEKNRNAAQLQATLEAQIQNLTRQLSESTKALQRVESDLEDLQLANQKVAKSKLSEANASDLDALEAQRELNVLKRSLGEAQLAVQRYERENATLKSQRETLDHKLQIALVEQDTLARELVQVQDELSEMSCRWEQEKSLRENEELTFRDRLRKEEKMIKDRAATIMQLEEELSSLQRELDKQKDVLETTQDCAARDMSQALSQLQQRYQEQLEGMVSERENLKARIRADEAEKESLQNRIQRLEKQLGDRQSENDRSLSAVEELMRAHLNVEREKLEDQVRKMQHECADRIAQMEQLVAAARLEAASEIASERRKQGDAHREIADAQRRCDAMAEQLEDLSKEKIALQHEVERLKSRLDTATCETAEAEKQLFQSEAHHREEVDKLEVENSRLRSAERRLEAELQELEYRLTEADRTLKETMVLVDAPTPAAVPRMVGALAKDSRSKSERDQLAARVKEAEGLLVALSSIFGAPDFGSLPQLATQREGQRNSLKNAQVRLEEEIRLLRAELQDAKRMSCSEITSASDDIKRLKASLLRAESDRNQFEAELIFVQKQLADSATNMQALEVEVGRESSYAAQLREKLRSLSEERDDLVRQLNCAESQAQQLARDKNAYGERNELLEENKTRLEKENLDHLETIRRVSATNSQLRHELDQKNVSVKQQQSAHDVAMERFQHEISKLHEDSKRYKDQRDAALQALDMMQNETKESHQRANRLSSNFDAVESELVDLRAQRNAAIEQVNQARYESERMRQSLMRQQQEIAALQDFIDKHKMRQQDTKHVDGFLEDVVQKSLLDAQAAEERERRRTKELMGVVATVWDYRGSDKGRRSSSKGRDSTKGPRAPGRSNRDDETSSKYSHGTSKLSNGSTAAGEGVNGNPRDSIPGASSLLSTFTGIFGTAAVGAT